MVHTVDTDVLILVTRAFHYLETVDELWVAFRSGKNFWYLPAHDIATTLSPDKCTALPVLHAFSGFDTVSFFADHGKKTSCVHREHGWHLKRSLLHFAP